MSAAVALSSLGADLAFSVSYNIASELLESAHEAGLSEEELIGIVLALSVVLGALPSSLKALRTAVRTRLGSGAGVAPAPAAADVIRLAPDVSIADTAPVPGLDIGPTSGVFEFFALFLRMAQRISVSICVQLVASNVRTREPLRAVRIVSLLGVSIFFMFLESTSHVGQSDRK